MLTQENELRIGQGTQSSSLKPNDKVGAEVRTQTARNDGSKANSSRRINPDSIQTLWFTVGVVGFLAATSFMVSFAGMTEVAKWVGLPSWMLWTVPAFIDMAIIAYSLAVLIHRSRGEATWASWLSLSLFTAVSVIANAAHAFSVEHAIVWQAWIGAGIAALAPVGVFAATEELGRLAVEQPAPRAKKNGTQDLGEYRVAPATEALEPAMPIAVPVQAPIAVPAAEVAAVPDPEDEPDPDPTPDKVPTKDEVTPEESVEEQTPLFDQVTQATEQVPALEPAPVASAPKLTVVKATHKAAPVAELDKLARWVARELAADRTPSAKGVSELLGVSERTARRKLSSLKETHAEVFNTPERKQA